MDYSVITRKHNGITQWFTGIIPASNGSIPQWSYDSYLAKLFTSESLANLTCQRLVEPTGKVETMIIGPS